MKVTDLPIHELRPADWNANEVQPEMMAHLRESITQFGLVENLWSGRSGRESTKY